MGKKIIRQNRIFQNGPRTARVAATAWRRPGATRRALFNAPAHVVVAVSCPSPSPIFVSLQGSYRVAGNCGCYPVAVDTPRYLDGDDTHGHGGGCSLLARRAAFS
ncbi:hypothetical protein PG990_014514 [Apiospora arundinis]